MTTVTLFTMLEPKRYLLLDTETGGLPKKYGAQPSDDDNWPRMLQLAWALCKENGQVEKSHSFYVKHNGSIEISEEASNVNGLTLDFLNKNGMPFEEGIAAFVDAFNSCDVLVAHNIAFDYPVVQSELLRYGAAIDLKSKPHLCTMLTTIKYCGLLNAKGAPKRPKLAELYTHVTGKEIQGAHDARYDVNALWEAFFLARTDIPAWQ